MKGRKRLSRLLSALCMTAMLLSACGKETVSKDGGENKGKTGKDVIKLYNRGSIEESTEDGFYHMNNKGFLRFFDYKTKKDVFVCSRPDCKHEEWREDTPVEERCEAHLGGFAAGFVKGERLYLLVSHLREGKDRTQIISSRLDRSDTKLIAEIDSRSFSKFVVSEKMLYLAMDAIRMKKHKDGSLTTSAKSDCAVYAVDLMSGAVAELLHEEKGFNNGIDIIAAGDEKLYIRYLYHEKEFKGDNFKESKFRQEYFSLHTGTKERKPIFTTLKEEEVINSAFVKGGKMLAFVSVYGEDWENPKKEIRSYDLSDESYTLIDEYEGFLNDVGDSFFYKVKGKPGYQELKKDGEEKISHEEMKLPEIEIKKEAGPYFYIGMMPPKGDYKKGFVKKEDLLKGKMEPFLEVK